MSESDKNTLVVLLEEVGSALSPLKEYLDSPEDFHSLLLELGWDIPSIPEPLADLAAFVQELIDLIEAGELSGDDLPDLIRAIKNLFQAISAISSSPDSAFPPGIDVSQFKNEVPKRLIDLLIIEYVADNHPRVNQFLKAASLFRVEEVEATATRPAYFKREVVWSQIGTILDDPLAALSGVYKWGMSDFDANLFLETVMELAESFGLQLELEKPKQNLLAYLNTDATQTNDFNYISAKHVLYRDYIEAVFAEAGIGLFILPETPALKPGFAILPYAEGDISETIDLSETFQLVFELGFDLTLGVGVIVRPERGIDFVTDIIPSVDSGTAPPSSGFMTIGVQTRGSTENKTVLIGSPESSRFEVGLVSLKGGVRVDSASDLDVYGEFDLQDAAIVISPGNDADSFLSSLLPEDGFSIDFSLLLGYSKSQGFYFGGSGGLEVSLPAHIDLGIIEIVSSTLAIKISTEGIPIELGGTIKGNLGPLKAVVENIGLRGTFSFPSDSSGNLGPMDLALGFKPPNGVGLSIDAGVVKGGGYLYFDFDKEEYAGVLELDLNGIVSVKAIGLVTTRLPDGSKGFSLLLIITAEFGSPIQLSFGFTLSGVGGLLGLNRTMRLEVIATGIRDGGINSVMFPQNVVENAPRIISDLKKYFPVEEGTFLIGPMVKIGWGTPNLVTVSLGIIIEIPGNIAILGVLKVALPDEDTALIVIQVNFMGAIEFDKKRLWFFAALYDSRVLFITLEGEMGLLVGWGDDASFVVSVGGFHPAFNPPPLPFGSLARIAISILNTDYARIRVEGYFAVTSNSVQFGARVEMFFGLDAFKVDGHLAFDALFRFSPFYFIISISASLSVKVFGVGLFSVRFRGSLEGPTPWHVEGTGSISLLFFDIDVDFSHTWGNEAETTLPPIDVMPLLTAEFEKLENWKAVLQDSNKLLVSLRSFEQGAVDLILHPVGTLQISQRAVPLGVTIDKVGNQKPADANLFDVSVSSTGIDEHGIVEELFAVGQHFNKSDGELLSAKSFQPIKGGTEIGVTGEQYSAPQAVKRVVRYEKIIIDTHYRRFIRPFFAWFGSLFTLFLNGNAVSHSLLSSKQQKLRMPYQDTVAVGTTLYGVAYNHDNSAYNAQAMNFTSQVQAEEFMRQQIAANGKLARQLHVIPQVEMQEAA